MVTFDKSRLWEWWVESLNRIASKENVKRIMKFSKYQKLLKYVIAIKGGKRYRIKKEFIKVG